MVAAVRWTSRRAGSGAGRLNCFGWKRRKQRRGVVGIVAEAEAEAEEVVEVVMRISTAPESGRRF